jgi:hypothetical protein
MNEKAFLIFLGELCDRNKLSAQKKVFCMQKN